MQSACSKLFLRPSGTLKVELMLNILMIVLMYQYKHIHYIGQKFLFCDAS